MDLLTVSRDILIMFGITLIGITTGLNLVAQCLKLMLISSGELLHRVAMLVNTRHSSHISQVTILLISRQQQLMLFQVFNMKDVPWYLLVTVVGLLIMMMTGDDINMIMFIKLMSVSIVWSIIRVTGVMDNAVDDLKIFSKIQQYQQLSIR